MLSRERIERLRGSLLEQQASLRQQLIALEDASKGDSVGSGNHMADDATAAFDQARSVSLRRAHQRTLEQVDKALQRIATGRYGACERCGNEIDFARLKAVPQATLCMSCQRLVEL